MPSIPAHTCHVHSQTRTTPHVLQPSPLSPPAQVLGPQGSNSRQHSPGPQVPWGLGKQLLGKQAGQWQRQGRVLEVKYLMGNWRCPRGRHPQSKHSSLALPGTSPAPQALVLRYQSVDSGTGSPEGWEGMSNAAPLLVQCGEAPTHTHAQVPNETERGPRPLAPMQRQRRLESTAGPGHPGICRTTWVEGPPAPWLLPQGSVVGTFSFSYFLQ